VVCEVIWNNGYISTLDNGWTDVFSGPSVFLYDCSDVSVILLNQSHSFLYRARAGAVGIVVRACVRVLILNTTYAHTHTYVRSRAVNILAM